jgi:hypothetical protein
MQTKAAQAAAAAADQAAQEVWVHPIVASCHLAMIAQPLSGAVELILADDSSHRGYSDPLGRIYG